VTVAESKGEDKGEEVFFFGKKNQKTFRTQGFEPTLIVEGRYDADAAHSETIIPYC